MHSVCKFDLTAKESNGISKEQILARLPSTSLVFIHDKVDSFVNRNQGGVIKKRRDSIFKRVASRTRGVQLEFIYLIACAR